MSAWSESLRHGRSRVLAFCWLGWVFDFYDLILFSFCKRSVAADLQLDLVTVAWIEGLTLFATAVGGFVLGRLADRIGARPAMVTSILVYAAGAAATGLAQGGTSLLLARVCTGLGVGGEWGIGHAVVAATWSGRSRDLVHALLQAGSPVAMALAAVAGCFVAPHTGWRAVFLAGALPALLALLARWAMPGPALPARAAPVAAVQLFRPPLTRTSWLLLLLLSLHMLGFWCVYAELPNALLQQLHFSPQQVGWWQLQVNAVHLLADVGFGVLALRLGRGRVFVATCVLSAGGHLLLALRLPDLAADATALPAALVLLGLGAGTWSCFGALFGCLYPEALRATAAASFYNLSRATQLFAKPALAAAFAAAGSFAPALWIGAVAALASAAGFALLPAAAWTVAGDAGPAGSRP